MTAVFHRKGNRRMNPTEQWRVVVGWEGFYEVSNLGRVRSLPRTIVRRNGVRYRVRERILKPQRVRPCSDMTKVSLAVGGHSYCKLVHLLVRDAWGEREAA
jgi:NUMOD4 motif